MMENHYAILTLKTGGGPERFKENHPDLVIMDIKMPGRSGIEILKK
jgi:YesN/AraC family two-component response regulator